MRSRRAMSESNVYHVISRGTGRQLIFEDDIDRLHFLDLLQQAKERYKCLVYAWCLMGNHVHLLIKSPIPELSSCMKSICGGYALYFNRRHERVGHLFQGRYASEPVNDDAYFLTVLRYIHQNPEKSKLSKTDAYPWSSYCEYAGDFTHASLCDTAFALELIGGPKRFVEFHRHIDNSAICMEIDRVEGNWRSIPESVAPRIARGATQIDDLSILKTLDKPARNSAIGKMRKAGLSVRQIERITGISRGIVQSVPPTI